MTARKAPAPGALPLIIALAAILTACGGGDNSGPNPPPPPPPATVASVAVTPAAPQLAPGETVQLAAQPRDASGNPITGRTVTWSSDNTSVATVSNAGLVSALTAGTAKITATADNRSGTATVSVLVPIATLAVTPTSVTLVPNQTSTLAATALSAAGDTLTGRTIAWSTSNPSAATVSATGVVTAVGAGSTTITAAAEGKTATAAVTVAEGGVVNGGGTSTITSANGAVTIEVPAGAAPDGLPITIEAEQGSAIPEPDGTWRLGPTSWRLGPDGTQFAQPVTVRLKYDPAVLPPWVTAGDLGVHRFDGTAWHALTDIVVDAAAGTISGKTTGFSTFAFTANLPPVTLTPMPAQVNYNLRSVQFTATVPNHPAAAFQYRWVTTGSNGSLIDLFTDEEKEYFASSPILPDGDVDLVGVEISAQQVPGGPFVPIANTTVTVTSDLNWSFELNPVSQKVGFREMRTLDAVLRERDGGIYQSPDLFFEYTSTANAGDMDVTAGQRVSNSTITYTAWAPSKQVKDPPRGDKITVKFVLRQLVWNGTAFSGHSQTYNYRDVGTADAFLEIGEDTYVPRFDVLTIPTAGGACVAAVLYVKKVPGATSYDLKSDNFSLSGFGTTFNRTWSAATGTGMQDIVDLGSQWRVGMTSGCATQQFAITFRQDLYATTFANIEAEVKVTVP